MKYSIFLLMILAAGCGMSAGKQNEADTLVNRPDDPAAERIAKAEPFLQLFTVLNPNDLEVSSPNTDSNGVYTGMVGKWIDSSMLQWFPASLEIREYGSADNLHGGYFAVGRFPQGEYEMLVVRAPGTYESSALYILAWHKPTAEVKDYVLVADTWGDAGDAMTTSSWLQPVANALEVRMVTYSSHEDIEDTTAPVESSAEYGIFQFKNGAFDTVGMRSRRNEAFFRSKLKDSYQEPDSVYLEHYPKSNSHE